jgi:hypothetical protein
MIAPYLQGLTTLKHSGLLKWRGRSPVERTAAFYCTRIENRFFAMLVTHGQYFFKNSQVLSCQ